MQTHDTAQPKPNTDKKLQLTIVYNGIEKPLEVQPHASVKSILERAIHMFTIAAQPHLLSLFRADGTKVEENQSASEAGLADGAVLYLRQDAVKGGSALC